MLSKVGQLGHIYNTAETMLMSRTQERNFRLTVVSNRLYMVTMKRGLVDNPRHKLV